jgi:hypothetical protein
MPEIRNVACDYVYALQMFFLNEADILWAGLRVAIQQLVYPGEPSIVPLDAGKCV